MVTRSETRMPMINAINSDSSLPIRGRTAVRPLSSIVAPGAQARGVRPLQQHNRVVMVSGKSSDQGVGLIDVVNPMHLRRVAVTVVTPLPRALRKGGSQRVEMLVIVAHRDDGVDGQAGRVLADASCSADSSPPSSSIAPSTAIRYGSSPERHRASPSRPARMESGLALNESSISVKDIPPRRTVDTAMRCGLMRD